VGLGAGNLTMGSTATETWHSSFNTGVGANALFSNTTGYANSAFGSSALNYNTTGNYNLGLGYKAGENLTSGSGNIIIGYDIDAPSATADNQLNIGNLILPLAWTAGTRRYLLATSALVLQILAQSLKWQVN